MSQKKTTAKNSPALRAWLHRAIWCFGGITLAGLVLGGVLLALISKTTIRNPHGQPGQQVEIYSKEQVDKFITSVLITIQNQPLNREDAPADMVFIASFNAFEQRLTMVSLANQTLVEVEGRGKKTLGETYALGGPGLLVNTINQNFGLDMQNYACTDTHSLAAMIDLLGGIKMQLTPGEAEYINNALGKSSEDIQAGDVNLTGVQSMVHAMASLGGEAPLSNLRRSLNLVDSAIANMRKTATKEAMLPLLSLVFGNIQTNLDIATLRDIGYEILKAEEIEYRNLILPFEGSWKPSGLGSNKLQADIPGNAVLLRETLYNAK